MVRRQGQKKWHWFGGCDGQGKSRGWVGVEEKEEVEGTTDTFWRQNQQDKPIGQTWKEGRKHSGHAGTRAFDAPKTQGVGGRQVWPHPLSPAHHPQHHLRTQQASVRDWGSAGRSWGPGFPLQSNHPRNMWGRPK